MRILIAAGGTGGHISPGTALAEEALRRGHEVEFVSLVKNMAYPDLNGRPYPVTLHEAPRFPSSLFSLFLYPVRVIRAVARVAKSVRAASAVIGLGGYPSVPSLIAAVLYRRPVYLCEQNAVPGNVTRLFSRIARRVFLTLETDVFAAKGLLTGNPIRTALLMESEKPAEKTARPVVLVLGGSQGARQINEMVSAILEKSDPWTREVDWLFQCGEAHTESMKVRLNQRSDVKLFGFHAQIQEYYRKAAVLISRSGAGILTEAALFGLPCILVPLPGSRDDHQLGNARVFEKAGAARVVYQKDADPGLLERTLRELLSSPDLLQEMGKKSRALAVREAAARILDAVEGGKP